MDIERNRGRILRAALRRVKSNRNPLDPPKLPGHTREVAARICAEARNVRQRRNNA